MEDFNKKFNEIIKDNYSEPAEDYYLLETIKWLHTGKCLLDDSELDKYVDEDEMIRHIIETYGLSEEAAKSTMHYAEDSYLINTNLADNE